MCKFKEQKLTKHPIDFKHLKSMHPTAKKHKQRVATMQQLKIDFTISFGIAWLIQSNAMAILQNLKGTQK